LTGISLLDSFGFAYWASLVGGIYTKAADMGADLAGTTVGLVLAASSPALRNQPGSPMYPILISSLGVSGGVG